MPVVTGTKPSNASWRAKATLTPDGNGTVVPDPNYGSFPHGLDQVVIGWYDDRVKVTFNGAGPAHISQAFLTGDGRNVIVEFKPSS